VLLEREKAKSANPLRCGVRRFFLGKPGLFIFERPQRL